MSPMNRIATAALAAFGVLACSQAMAQMPADIAEKIAAIGRVVDPAKTGEIYTPLHEKEPYSGIKVARDVKYGPDPRNVVDVFIRRLRHKLDAAERAAVSTATGSESVPQLRSPRIETVRGIGYRLVMADWLTFVANVQWIISGPNTAAGGTNRNVVVPGLNTHGEIVCAVGIAGPSARLSTQAAREDVRRVHAAATAIGDALGFNVPEMSATRSSIKPKVRRSNERKRA